MADDTHLKLAHRLLTAAEQPGMSTEERVTKIGLAQGYALLAIAETLGRIAGKLEADERITVTLPTTVETSDGGPRRPITDNPQA